MKYSKLNILPYSSEVENEFNIKFCNERIKQIIQSEIYQFKVNE